MSAASTHHLRRILLRYTSPHRIKTPHLLPHLATITTIRSHPYSTASPSPTAQSISNELLKGATSTVDLPLSHRLDLHFSHVHVNHSLLLQVLNLSSEAGRTVLGFHKWLSQNPNFKPDDESLSYLIEFLGRRKDFKAIDEVLVEHRGIVGPKSVRASIDRLARAGRATQAIAFFEKVEESYGVARDRDLLAFLVSALCDGGFASHAEKLVKKLADEFFPDEFVCDTLVRGWCLSGKLDEAWRLVGEIRRGGFDLSASAYNSILDCVCKLCRKKEPFRLQSEADKILIEMETMGVPRNTDTFNVLITNLCKIRKTEDALNHFRRMGEWGCSPDRTTLIMLAKSLYQAARVEEGDEMIDLMKSMRFGDSLDKKVYYGFIKILCGIERIDHAMEIFSKMKGDGREPGIKSYELLMGKLCAHGRVDKANALFHEAQSKGLPVTPKVYKVDPRFVKKPKSNKKERPKRETLPEKMARKRRRLRKLWHSFVKKPRTMRQRA